MTPSACPSTGSCCAASTCKNGYADVEISNAKAELSPDRSGFFLTYTLNEGQRYRVGKVDVISQLRNLDGDDLRGDHRSSTGRLV